MAVADRGGSRRGLAGRCAQHTAHRRRRRRWPPPPPCRPLSLLEKSDRGGELRGRATAELGGRGVGGEACSSSRVCARALLAASGSITWQMSSSSPSSAAAASSSALKQVEVVFEAALGLTAAGAVVASQSIESAVRGPPDSLALRLPRRRAAGELATGSVLCMGSSSPTPWSLTVLAISCSYGSRESGFVGVGGGVMRSTSFADDDAIAAVKLIGQGEGVLIGQATVVH